ncbi:hypothetical protein LTS18_000641, partial [Coniosporium uncinatum]
MAKKDESPGPPSPTLTNPEMILPSGSIPHTTSPIAQRPPSPSQVLRKVKSQTDIEAPHDS